MTLTFELDLDILPLDIHTKNHVRMSVRSALRVVTHTQTHRNTHTQTMSKLLHPIADVECNNLDKVSLDAKSIQTFGKCPLVAEVKLKM